jgi:hypothetical protein
VGHLSSRTGVLAAFASPDDKLRGVAMTDGNHYNWSTVVLDAATGRSVSRFPHWDRSDSYHPKAESSG